MPTFKTFSLRANYALTVTADAVSGGLLVPLAATDGGEPGSPVPVVAGATVTVGPYGDTTKWRLSSEYGELTYVATRVTAEPQGAVFAINTQTGTAYTLVLTDAGKVIEPNNASANTLTIPPNSSVAFPLKTRIDLVQFGAGQTTIAAGAGVTIRSSGGKLKLTGQYSAASLYKRATDEWVLIGDIAA